MKILKEYYTGILVFSTLFLINIYLWLNELNRVSLSFDVKLTSLFGSFVLLSLFITFFLSTRNRLLIKLLGSFDQLYQWHRFFAMTSLSLIFLHQITSTDHGLVILDRYLLNGIEINELGELSRNIFLFLILLALFSFLFKYHHFKFLHRFMLVPYLLGIYHGFASSWVDLLDLSALSVFMITTTSIGVLSSIYMMFLYEDIQFKRTGLISEINLLTSDIIDLKITLKKIYRIKPGQFAFLMFENNEIFEGPHPFTVSGTHGNHIYFTIKNLGDHTKFLFDKVKINDVVHVSKPYGNLVFESLSPTQVWIAGGVGITPFLSYVRSPKIIDRHTHLYYAVNKIEHAIHINLFRQLEIENKYFHFHLIETSTQGRLDVKMLNLDASSSVWMCGPKPMIDQLNQKMKLQHPNLDIHYEAFNFTGSLVKDLYRFTSSKIRALLKSF